MIFLAQKFTTSVLDSGLSASRDISPDPLCSSFLVLQPMLSLGINCAKLIALLNNFKALGDLTKKTIETNPVQLGTVSRGWGLE